MSRITERSIRRDMADEDYTDEQIEEAVDNYWDNQIDKFEANRDEREEIWP